MRCLAPRCDSATFAQLTQTELAECRAHGGTIFLPRRFKQREMWLVLIERQEIGQLDIEPVGDRLQRAERGQALAASICDRYAFANPASQASFSWVMPASLRSDEMRAPSCTASFLVLGLATA
jgi:hypothetical protein